MLQLGLELLANRAFNLNNNKINNYLKWQGT